MNIWHWMKGFLESPSHKKFRASRRDLHTNRQEMQRSISVAMDSSRKSSKALKVAENALKLLEKHQNEDCKK